MLPFLGQLTLNLSHYINSCFRKGEMNVMILCMIQEAVNTKEFNRKRKCSDEKKKHALETMG